MSQGNRVTHRSQLHELVMARIQCRISDQLLVGEQERQLSNNPRFVSFRNLHADPAHESNIIDARRFHNIINGTES